MRVDASSMNAPSSFDVVVHDSGFSLGLGVELPF